MKPEILEALASAFGTPKLTEDVGKVKTWALDVPAVKCSDTLHVFFREGGLCQCGALILDPAE